MKTTAIDIDDPFAPAPPDEVAELESLARAITLADGFALLFACCNQADHRDRLMSELRALLPGVVVQSIALHEPTRSLLEELRARLESPPPGAVFVYGIESWLPSGPEAESSPFVLNLNAARNSFPRVAPCPLVFWLPQHILSTLAHAAPDFCSVRSGLYSFCATPQVRDRIASELTSVDMATMAGLAYQEKLERAKDLAAMLAEYESLPQELRDPIAESRLLDSQATIHQVLGNLQTAEPLFRRALAIRETMLGPDHLGTAAILNNLGLLYESQSRYVDAEPLFRRALAIREATLGPDHPVTALDLNNLAFLYTSQGWYGDAELLHRRALAIREAKLGPDHPDTAATLNNLAGLYATQDRSAEAEPLYQRALAIYEASFGPDHPNTAASLNNLASLYESQGRYAEAEPLYRHALEVVELLLGLDHPNTATCLENYSSLLGKMRRENEAEQLSRRAKAARAAHVIRNAIAVTYPTVTPP